MPFCAYSLIMNISWTLSFLKSSRSFNKGSSYQWGNNYLSVSYFIYVLLFLFISSERIQRYFGESIAMYFSFLGFYTMALVPPAAMGLFSKIFTQSDMDLVIFFSFFNLIWATIFLESWKRNCATLAYEWGTINMEPFSKARASYYGELGINPVTGRLEPQYPKWKRTLKFYAVSLPVVLFCLYCAVEVSF